MLDKRAQEWLSRLQGNGPRLASLGLAALIAVELARIAIAFLGGGPVKSPQPEFGNIAPRAGQHAGFDIQSVVSAHLFGIATADPSARDPANAPPSTSNLVLAGTIATQNPKRGVAIINDGGPSKVYSVGDNVGGASLHSVYLDHVILDRGGALETLILPRLLGPGMHARPPTSRGGADPRTAAAVENIRQLVQQDPNILDQVMRTVPSYDSAAGKLRGFRAYPGRNRQVFNRLGLKSGDLVTAINGTVLDDPQRSQEVFNTIQSSDHVTVDVERGGQKQQITLNIAQVAAQATKDLEGDASPAASATGDTAARATTTTSGGTAGAPAAGAPPNEAPQPPPPQPSAVPGNPNQNPNQ
jgi:general secretion pathway protein C